jgi:hypothetical protein
MGYLLYESTTNPTNAAHSKDLMLELFKKLQGSALSLFTSLNYQHYYLQGGRGIEMVHALVNKFHPLDNGAFQQIIASMQSLELLDTEDLSSYKNKLKNYNLQLSWVGQEMSPSFLVFLAQSQLGKSHYESDITALQMSHTASGTSFTSLDDLCIGLEWLDKLCGLPYGGAAITLKTSSKPPPKKPNGSTVGFVVAVQDVDSSTPDNHAFHKDSWVGAINLPEAKVKLLCQMFKCVQCNLNDHTLPSCPHMKNWVIKRKPHPDNTSDKSPPETTVGGVNSVLAPQIPVDDLNNHNTEESEDLVAGHTGSVEFDLLDSLAITTINDEVSPYFDLNHPMGSVHSVSSSQLSNLSDCHDGTLRFNLIVDSSCTRHMFPFKELFISYKETPSSFVILADKSRVPCLGSGTVHLYLQSKPIIIHDVLHVPKLRSPLLSVRCFRRITGCSFIADNTGSYLTFPTFILPVDDSSDCTISGRLCSSINVEFDSCITGSAAAVSDNTRFRNNHRPPILQNSHDN